PKLDPEVREQAGGGHEDLLGRGLERETRPAGPGQASPGRVDAHSGTRIWWHSCRAGSGGCAPIATVAGRPFGHVVEAESVARRVRPSVGGPPMADGDGNADPDTDRRCGSKQDQDEGRAET